VQLNFVAAVRNVGGWPKPEFGDIGHYLGVRLERAIHHLQRSSIKCHRSSIADRAVEVTGS